MAVVERISFRWADKITVRREGDTLYVRGQNNTGSVRSGSEIQAPDLFRQYRNYGAEVPHVQFANARTDEDLVGFVRRYGPVNGKCQAPGPLARPDSAVEVTESIHSLRRERMIFASALQLLDGLRKGVDIDAANGLGDFVSACSQPIPAGDVWPEADRILQLLVRARGYGFQGNARELEEFLRRLRGTSVRGYGWDVLCLILCSFTPELVPVKGGLAEMPPRNKAGTLPALFFMLRRDCLDGQEIKICGQRECRRFFKVERSGQRFCTAECSQLQRQRDYWQRRGKEARAQRIANKRNKKGGKKRGTVQIPR